MARQVLADRARHYFFERRTMVGCSDHQGFVSTSLFSDDEVCSYVPKALKHFQAIL
jgi:hypothetical protein